MQNEGKNSYPSQRFWSWNLEGPNPLLEGKVFNFEVKEVSLYLNKSC